jgi:hypothetical protein
MKIFSKTLMAPDGAQVLFLHFFDPTLRNWMFIGITVDDNGGVIETRVSGDERQVKHLFATASMDLVKTIRTQAAGATPTAH